MPALKRFLCSLLILCALPLLAADSTIGNLSAKTTIPDAYVMPWEEPATQDWKITFQNLTNQILAGMASQAYAQGLTNNFAYTNWVGANYYPLANPSNFVGSAALSGYALLASNNLFTATNTFERDGIGTAITPIVYLTNATSAALGAQQVSPALMFGGQGWKTGTSTSTNVGMGFRVVPVQGTSSDPTATLNVFRRYGGLAETDTGTYFESGGALFVGAAVNIAATSGFLWNTRSSFYSPADGDFIMRNNAVAGFSRLFFGSANPLWSCIKVESTNAPTLSIRTGADANYASLVASNVTATGSLMVSNPVWKDAIADLSTLSKGGTATSRGEIFPGAVVTAEEWPVDAYGDGVVQFNHDLATTNAVFPNLYIIPHCHISVTNIPASTSNVTFKIQYYWAAINGTWTGATNGVLTNTLAVTAVNTHYTLPLGNITNNSMAGTISSLLRFRLSRITSTTGDVGTAGGGNVRMGDIDFHYPVNRLGSSGPTTY